MDGFSGYKSAAVSQLPGAVAVMDPLSLIIDALSSAASASSKKPHRSQGHPLYAARKTLLTGTDILTDTSQARLMLYSPAPTTLVHTTWRIYQVLTAYRDPPGAAKHLASSSRRSPARACHTHRAYGQNSNAEPGTSWPTRPPPHQQRPHRSHQRTPSAASPKDSSATETTAYAAYSGGFQHLLHP